MKKLLYTLCVLWIPLSSIAQTVHVSPSAEGGFELGTTPASNGWTTSSNTGDGWAIGSGTAVASGTNCAYISSNGTTYGYSQFSSYALLYRDITIPAGENKLTVNFDWKCAAEGGITSNFDNLKVFLVPSGVTLPSGSEISTTYQIAGPNSILSSNIYNSTTLTWANETIIKGLSAGTYTLVFSFKSDGTTISGNPAAVDNISVVSSAPGIFISVNSGNWNNPATWQANAVPTALDSAVVSTGHIVSINAANLEIGGLLIDGTLNYTTTPTSFKVNKSLSISNNGIFEVFNSTTGKTLNVVGNIKNDGLLDISVGTTTAGNLTLSGTVPQTVSGSGSFGSKIRNLILSNTSTSIPNINWLVNNVVVEYNLTITNQKVNLGGNRLQYGNATNIGNTFSFTSGGFMNGTFSRWWNATTTGYTTTTAITSTPTSAAGRYPFYDAIGKERVFYLGRTTPTLSGTYDVIYNDATTSTHGLSIVDGATTINSRWDGHFTVTQNGPTAATYQVSIFAPDAMFLSASPNILLSNAPISGTQLTGFANLGSRRNLITEADLLNSNGIYIGAAQSSLINTSLVSGDWNNPSTWSLGIVPDCFSSPQILSGHTVTVNSAGNSVKQLTISSGGTLLVSSGDLTVGCTDNNNLFVNNGTTTVTGGVLTVNGQMTHNSGSTFNQSGGEISIDPNSGTTATSLAANVLVLNTNLLNWTGGRITIVDPTMPTTSYNSVYYSNSNHVNIHTGNHTLRLGDGVSTQAGGNSTNPFIINSYPGSGRINFKNVEVNANGGTNRHLTLTYSLAVDSNLIIHPGSEMRFSSAVYVGGNIINNGIIRAYSSLYLSKYTGTTQSATPNSQVISGTGVFHNVNSGSTTTANLSSLYVNNSNAAGVTLQVPLSISSTLGLTKGFVHTTNTNLLSLGTTTTAGTLSGGADTAYISGPFLRGVASANAANVFFPIGTQGQYAPLNIIPTTTAFSQFKGEAIIDATGTMGSTIGTLSNMKWSLSSVTGTYTNILAQIGHAGIVNNNTIVSSSTLGGVYENTLYGVISPFNGSTVPPSLSSQNPILAANFQNFLSYGTSAGCSGTPAPGNTLILSSDVCANKSTVLKVQNVGVGLGITYAWESSLDNISYTTVANQNDSIALILASGQYVRAAVTCQNGMTTGYTVPVKLDLTYQITSAPDVTKCGPGSVSISAAANSGSIYWFNNPANILSNGTGSPYSFNVVNDTTLYAKAGTQTSANFVLGDGSTNAGGSYITGNIFYGLFGGAKVQNIIRASELSALGFSAGQTITSIAVTPNTVGSGNSYPNYMLSIGHTNQNVATTSFALHSSLTNVFNGTVSLIANTPFVFNFGTGTANTAFVWDGVSNILIEHLWTNGLSTATTSNLQTNATSFVSSGYGRFDGLSQQQAIDSLTAAGTYSYRPKYTFNTISSCFSTTEDVLVDVTPAPALTLDRNVDSICVGSTLSAIQLTSNTADYDTYVWTPTVSGNAASGWNVNATSTSTFVLTASQSTGAMCSNSTNYFVYVQTDIPVSPVAAQNPYDICEGSTSNILNVSGSNIAKSYYLASGTLNLAINSSTPIQTSTLNISSIPSNATITGIKVGVNMTHPYIGDIELTLTSPSGASSKIFDNHGSGGDNFVNTIISSSASNLIATGSAPYTGTFGPTNSLSPLFVGNVNGNWVFKVEDTFPSSDHGVFQNWTLEIEYTVPADYLWYDAASNGNLLGSGNTLESVGTTVLASPAVVGTYNYYAVASNAFCKSTPTAIPVNVHALPTVIAGADLNVCNGSSITLQGSGNAVTYTWNNGVTDNTPFNAFAGNFVVTGISTYGCINKDSLQVTVLASPTVIAGADVTECHGTQVTLTATGDANSYTWNNGVTDATAFPLTTPGYYVVTGLGANGCSSKDSLLATVHALPVVSAGSDITTCENSNITLSGSGADSYVWDNNVTDGVAFVQPVGTVTYVVIGTDANGCTNTDDVDVIVNPLTTLTGIADFAVCENNDASINVTVANETSGTWITNGLGVINPNVNAHQITYTPAAGETGQIYFVYTAVGACNTEFDSVKVNINANPVVNLGADVVTTNATEVLTAPAGMISYSWSNGDATQTITVSQNGSYSVVVVDANGCSGTDTINFITTFSVENYDGTNGSIDVFPNPTKDIVNLQFNDVKAEQVKIDVLSINGAVISTSLANLTSGNGLVVLNVSNLSEGVYIVRMSYNNTMTTHRIIVNK